MKYLSLFFLLIPFYSVGQFQLYNSDLLDTSNHQLYLNTGNRIIFNSGRVFDEIRVTGKDPLRLQASTNYILNVYPVKLETTSISLYRKSRLLFSSEFKIEILPDPVVRVGYYPDTFMTKQQIKATPYLKLLYPRTNYHGNMSVIGFTLSVEYQSGDISRQEYAVSEYFSQAQLNLIDHLTPGDRIFFTSIRGGGPDARIVSLPSFSVTTK